MWCCMQVPVHHRLHAQPDGVLWDHGCVRHCRPQPGKCAVQLLLRVVESVHRFPDRGEPNGWLVEVVVSTSIYCDTCFAMLFPVPLYCLFLFTFTFFFALSVVSHRPSFPPAASKQGVEVVISTSPTLLLASLSLCMHLQLPRRT